MNEISIRKLEKYINQGKMSLELKNAIKEIITALQKNKLEEAEELTAVKSFVCGSINDNNTNHFCEDSDYNEKKLGSSIYVYLDGLHHELARSQKKLPSGMMIISYQNGYKIQKRELPSKTESPTIKLMIEERNR